ncbi:MAG: LppX_LprAFG lipoprotein [Candidatus Limnocylindria bacterium]
MFRRFAPSLVVAALVLAACGGAGPALSDPEEIITQGIDATGDLTSFHILLEVDGTFSVPEMGGDFSLDGTSLEGDLDLENEAAQLTFAVPAMLGLSGEVILADETAYLKTSMTGELYSKVDAPSGEMGTVTDPDVALEEVRTFLDEEGVETQKLDDVDCGDRTCYAVRMTIPSGVLADAGEEVDMLPTDAFGEALTLDLWFDRENLWLSRVSTSVTSDAVGTFSLTLTLSAFNEAVDVAPPPDDQVTDQPPILPF